MTAQFINLKRVRKTCLQNSTTDYTNNCTADD